MHFEDVVFHISIFLRNLNSAPTDLPGNPEVNGRSKMMKQLGDINWEDEQEGEGKEVQIRKALSRMVKQLNTASPRPLPHLPIE